MKPGLLIVLLNLFLCISVQAQQIRFTDTSNKWTMVEAGWGDPGQVRSYVLAAAYNSDTSIAGYYYKRLECLDGFKVLLALREDTVSGKIYFRFISPGFWAASQTDSLEHVFFDYKLKVDDTLRVAYGVYQFAHVVQSVDSVQLGARYHKIWQMRLIEKKPPTHPFRNYEFIEGIGTTEGPLFSVCPVVFESGMQLRCFTNAGAQPPCNPAIPLPYGWTPIWQGVKMATEFDNSQSCDLQEVAVGISTLRSSQLPVLHPNPGGRISVLTMADKKRLLMFSVTDVTGQTLVRKVFEDITEIPIGQYLSIPGVYFYTLQDAASGQRYTGRFIFR